MEQLRDWLYELVVFIAHMHDRLWDLNTLQASPLDDKQMHFVVTAAFGLLLFLLILPVFRFLTKHGAAGLMAWLLAFMTVLFVTFAIEIGQHVTGTGGLELGDIVYSVVGFLAVSVAVGLLYLLFRFFRWIFR